MRRGALLASATVAALFAGGLTTASTASNALPAAGTLHHRAVTLEAPAAVRLKGVDHTAGPTGITQVTASFAGTLGVVSTLGVLLDPYDVYMRFEGTAEVKCAVTLPALLSGDSTATCDWTAQPVRQRADRPAALRVRVV